MRFSPPYLGLDKRTSGMLLGELNMLQEGGHSRQVCGSHLRNLKSKNLAKVFCGIRVGGHDGGNYPPTTSGPKVHISFQLAVVR